MSTTRKNLKVGRTPRGHRVWMEGDYLAAAGFRPGVPITVTFEAGRIRIFTDPKGTRIVAKKNETRPVIDLIGEAVGDALGAAERISVEVVAGKITIRPQ